MRCRSISLVSNQWTRCEPSRAGRPSTSRSGSRRRGGRAVHGDSAREFRWASVTKPVTALACLVAAEEGAIDLDAPAGPPGSTFRHLLAHASGLPLAGGSPIARPGRAADLLRPRLRRPRPGARHHAEMPFADYLRAAVLEPLGLGARYEGRPGSGLYGSLDDLLALGRELLAPTLVVDRDARRGDVGAVPRPGRRAPGLRPPGAERLGPRLRAARRASRRTGPALATRPGPSATSAAAARSSGSTPRRRSPSAASPTATSATGRRGVAGVVGRGAGGAVSGHRAASKAVTGSEPGTALRGAVARRQPPTATTPATALPGWTPAADAPGISQLAPDLSGLTSRAAPTRGRSSGTAMRSGRATFTFATPKEAAEAQKRGAGDDYQASSWSGPSAATRSATGPGSG